LSPEEKEEYLWNKDNIVNHIHENLWNQNYSDLPATSHENVSETLLLPAKYEIETDSSFDNNNNIIVPYQKNKGEINYRNYTVVSDSDKNIDMNSRFRIKPIIQNKSTFNSPIGFFKNIFQSENKKTNITNSENTTEDNKQYDKPAFQEKFVEPQYDEIFSNKGNSNKNIDNEELVEKISNPMKKVKKQPEKKQNNTKVHFASDENIPYIEPIKKEEIYITPKKVRTKEEIRAEEEREERETEEQLQKNIAFNIKLHNENMEREKQQKEIKENEKNQKKKKPKEKNEEPKKEKSEEEPKETIKSVQQLREESNEINSKIDKISNKRDFLIINKNKFATPYVSNEKSDELNYLIYEYLKDTTIDKTQSGNPRTKEQKLKLIFKGNPNKNSSLLTSLKNKLNSSEFASKF
jgi:chemotaxis protein histidine kinase CheA